MKQTLLMALGVSALAFGATAVAAFPGPGGGPMTEDMTRQQVLEKSTEQFGKLDADGDGFVTKEEMAAGAKERRGERGAHRMHRPHPGPEGGMARLDENGDGEISRDEAMGPAAVRFDEQDTDGNGSLSREELEAARADRKERWKDRKDRRGERGERREAHWQSLDANGDEKISQTEMTDAALKRFAAADANSDGVVTVEERKAMREAHRKARKAD